MFIPEDSKHSQVTAEKMHTEDGFRPDPHPLDYDWRFTSATSKKLTQLLAWKSRVLLVSTPSICSYLSSQDQTASEVLLVDRQPLNDSVRQVNTDIGTSAPINAAFDVALIDPPWYLKETKRWISWAAQSIKSDGQLIASVWPESTRPTADSERHELFTWLKTWSDFSIRENYLEYKVPHFEEVAQRSNPNFNTEKTWIRGDLLTIKPFDRAELLPPITRQNEWLRYTIGRLQLALKLDNVSRTVPVLEYISDNSWIWPHVSRRAQGRSEIGFWSSDNLAAKLSGSDCFIDLLESYLGLKSKPSKNVDSSAIHWFWQTFHSWNIPENRPELVKKWKHLD